MLPIVVRMGAFMEKKAIGAPEARAMWCKCADELGEMINHEAKTNPRYNDVSLSQQCDI